MPFYEYQCKQCGHQLEAMQKVNDAPLRKCPECGKSALQRLMSAPVFRLKGSGWYETDFKSDDEGKRNLAASDDAEPVKAADDKVAADKKDGKEDKQATDKPADKAVDQAASPVKKSESTASKGSKPAKKSVAAKPSPTRKPPKRATSAAARKKPAKRAASRR